LLIFCAAFGCDHSVEVKPFEAKVTPSAAAPIQVAPLAEPSVAFKAADAPLFEKLPPSVTGVDFAHRWQPRDEYERALLKTGFTGGGVCLGDYDGDGLCDMYLTRPHGGGRLLKNLGGFRFADATKEAGVEDDTVWTTGASFVDVNNDGALDLYVCALATANRLFVNQGDGTFQEAASLAGIAFNGASIKMLFADVDGDGDLDAYLVTNRLEPRTAVNVRYKGGPEHYTVGEEFHELVGVINLPGGKQQFVKAGQFDHLYRNELVETGELRFVEISGEAGITGNYHGLDATWWDYNDDARPDLYVANDFTDPDQLYRNNGDGTFTDVTLEALPHTPWFTMGSAAADFNNDGRLDLIATDMAGTTHYREKVAMGSMDAVAWFLDTAEPRQYMRNALFLNTGTDRFMEVAHMAGVAASDWTWSVKAADLDNDGLEDVFVTNGFTRDYLDSDFVSSLGQRGLEKNPLAWESAPELKEANLAFQNMGDLRFKAAAEPWGLHDVGISFGAALADLDNDGNLDLVVNEFGAKPSVYRNRGSQGRRVKIRLQGEDDNSFGIGAKVVIDTAAASHVRYVKSGGGYMSADEPLVYCGLGDQASIKRLTVHWPNGARQVFEDLQADRFYTITQPVDHRRAVESPSSPPGDAESFPTRFASSDRLNAVRHREAPFDDFLRQPLLPNKVSQWGPGMAWGDVDGDGDEDLLIGGGAQYPAQLWLQDEAGGFTPAPIAALEADAAVEDMGCLIFDADADGDQDLYIVSGGAECEPGDEVLRDRLYINQGPTADGSIQFTRDTDALPDYRDSGGAVAACDFDRDGDMDLFVGGRQVPGAYPTVPTSRLLANDRGRFSDVAASLAPGLSNVGMVTSAVWSDADGDGWNDLLVALEYGPVKLFGNEDGWLRDKTSECGTSHLTGWWNGIAACDVDRDGDLDYAVTNLGLNTKYKLSAEKPQYLFYGDFEGNGVRHIVEAKPGGAAGLLPVRGKSCSSNAMPLLNERFKTFHAFAGATLAEIYTPDCLSQSLRLEATTTESGVLLNDGQARFTFVPLPRLAQAAPAFGVQFLHADGDANPDMLIAHNFFGPQRETGRMDGGVSLLLTGNGDGTFEPVWPRESGVVIPGDAASAAVLDLNHDDRQDFVVAINGGPVETFMNSGLEEANTISVRLRGKPGNPHAVGSQVQLTSRSGRKQVAEICAGHGYLTQTRPLVQFGFDTDDPPESLEMRWPRGQSRRLPFESGTRHIELFEP